MSNKILNMFFGILIIISIFPQLGHTQVPQKINFQGYITDSEGNPLDGIATMLLSIYELETGGTALWSETQNVTVNVGIYNVILGEVNPISLPFDTQYYLGVTVGTDNEMIPRTALTSVPFALNSAMAELATSVADGSVNDDSITGPISASKIEQGEGSTLNADTLDGLESDTFATTANVNLLDARVTGLESQSTDPLISSIINSASSVSEPTPYTVSKLELWMRAVQSGHPAHPFSFIAEVDMNGDGSVSHLETNMALATAGVVTTFVQATTAMGQVSPWNAALPLYAIGSGYTANQAACDAVGSIGQITLCFFPTQDQTLQTIFISAQDNAGNTVYRKVVHGETDIERRDSLLDAAKNDSPRIERWMRVAKKGAVGHPMGSVMEVDTNGNGVIGPLTNLQLATAGVITQFVIATVAMNQISPWNAANPLYLSGGVTYNQAACDAAGTVGQITLCFSPAEDQTIQNIFISGQDLAGNVIYRKSYSEEVQEIERRAYLMDTAANAAPIIERWMRAAKKGSAAHPFSGIAEIDMNGDGSVSAAETNLSLAGAGVVTSFVAATVAMTQVSPWNAANALYADGGVTANQAACDAAGTVGQITLCFSPAEDQTIQNIFISGQDLAGNVIYRKSYGEEVQEIERRDYMMDTAANTAQELELWIRAAQKGHVLHPMQLIAEVDMDGDGVVQAAETNLALATAGVVNQFIVAAFFNNQISPWNAGLSLYRDGGVTANQAACDGVANNGQITLCYTPAQNQTIEAMFISAQDHAGNIIYRKAVHGVTKQERIDSVFSTLNETLPTIKKWITAGRKAGTAEGALTEIDTNGNGIVMVGTDMTNNVLAATGIITQFIDSRHSSEWAGWAGSPFNFTEALWVNGMQAVSQTDCDNVGHSPGTILLCYYPDEDETIQTVFISVTDENGEIFYGKILTAN